MVYFFIASGFVVFVITIQRNKKHKINCSVQEIIGFRSKI